MGNRIPGGVYLCQINEAVSCGACCGLYNVADPSYGAVEAMLSRHTDAFSRTPRELDALLAFKDETEAGEAQSRPFPEFHHCPFLGLGGSGRRRVVCLLHPLAAGNRGIDFRGLSFYGGMACRVYFCPTYYRLPAAYKEILRSCFSDWYLYGLVITEVALLKAFFQAVEGRLRRPIVKEDVLSDDRRMALVHAFCSLKLRWPFRDPKRNGLVNYFFEDSLYGKPEIDGPWGPEVSSSYQTIFRELVSSFASEKDLRRAEALLAGLIDELVLRIASHPGP